MPFFAKHSDEEFRSLEARLGICNDALAIAEQANADAQIRIAELEGKLRSAVSKGKGDLQRKRLESDKQIEELPNQTLLKVITQLDHMKKL